MGNTCQFSEGFFCKNCQGYTDFAQVINFRQFHVKHWKQKILMDFLCKTKSCITWVFNSVCNADWLENFRYDCTQGQLNNEWGGELLEMKPSRDKTKIDKEIIW